MTTIRANFPIDIGTGTFGPTNGRRVPWQASWLVRHALAVGGTGSGKTVILKIISEMLLAHGIPVVCIDVLGDISSLACPNDGTGTLEKIGIHGRKPDIMSDEDYQWGLQIGKDIRKKMIGRILTPLGTWGERIGFSPLATRPADYDRLKLASDLDVRIQADLAVKFFLQRVGMAPPPARKSAAPSLIQGIVTDALVSAWDAGEDFSGTHGLKDFSDHLEAWGAPPIDKGDLTKIQNGIRALSVGIEKDWMVGRSMDFNALLAPSGGRTPFVSINLHKIDDQGRHPWVVSQVLEGLIRWASAQGPAHDMPRCAIFIDEVRGSGNPDTMIMPPAGHRSLSGEALRRILRQGRHWGLSLLAGTQNPGDFDKATYSNFGSKFIGRLPEADAMKKVLQGVDLPNPSSKQYLERQIGSAKPLHMVAIQPDGYFHTVRLRGLAGPHMKLSPEQVMSLGKAGFLDRANSESSGRHQECMTALEGLAERFADVLSDDQRQTLRRMAQHIKQT
jgi:hypothetical protein